MLRSFPRACPSSVLLRGPPIQATIRRSTPICTLDTQSKQSRQASAHAISNPTLAGIEKRWEAMPPQEQADLWMALRDRMKTDWHELTLQEKKAGKFCIRIAYLNRGWPGDVTLRCWSKSRNTSRINLECSKANTIRFQHTGLLSGLTDPVRFLPLERADSSSTTPWLESGSLP